MKKVYFNRKSIWTPTSINHCKYIFITHTQVFMNFNISNLRYEDSPECIGKCWINADHIKLHFILCKTNNFNSKVVTEVIQKTIFNSHWWISTRILKGISLQTPKFKTCKKYTKRWNCMNAFPKYWEKWKRVITNIAVCRAMPLRQISVFGSPFPRNFSEQKNLNPQN